MADIKKSNVSCCGSCEEQQEEKHGFWYRLFHRKNKKNQNHECQCGHDHSTDIVFETKTSEPIFKTESDVQIKYAPAQSNSGNTVDLSLNDSKTESKVENSQKTEKTKSIPENQVHNTVSFVDYENYNYDKRREEWHKNAGHNKKQLICAICKDDDNWETIKLENGKHICYFCWVKKPTEESIKIVKSSSRQKSNAIPEDQKHTIVSLSEFDEYNYDQRRKDWHKKAGHNSKRLVCAMCKDNDNWETIQLENGKHICYFCWVKKPVAKKKKSSAKKKTSKSNKK